MAQQPSNQRPSGNPTQRGSVTQALTTKSFSQKAVQFEEQFSKLLPMQVKKNQIMTGPRVTGLLVNLWMTNEDIRACPPSTIFNAVAAACTMGLEFNSALGHSYIIPYNIRRKEGGQWVSRKEATWQAGYRGLLTLAHRSEKIEAPYAQVVMPGDEFEYEYGSKSFIRHRQGDRQPGDSVLNDFTHAWFGMQMRSGGYSFHVMSREEVLDIRNKAAQGFEDEAGKPKESSPWVKYAPEMIRKTPTKQHLKWADLTPHLGLATGLDDQAEAGVAQDQILDWKDYSAEDLDHETKVQVQGHGDGPRKTDAPNGHAKHSGSPNRADDGPPPFAEDPEEVSGAAETKPAAKDDAGMFTVADDAVGPFSPENFSAAEYKRLFELYKTNFGAKNEAQFNGFIGRWEQSKAALLAHIERGPSKEKA